MKRWHCSWPLLLAAVFGGALALPTNGQETKSSRGENDVTLDALVADALEKNPELRFYEAEISAAKARRKAAGLLANPEFNGGVGQKSVRGAGLSAEGVAWSVSVVQPFEWPGRIGLRKVIANRDVELAELGLGRFRVALTGRVRALAFGLFAAQEKAAAAREVAERFQALREVLVQRDPAGLTPLLETRVIEATELTMQRKASEATLATQAALLELNQLRGVAPTAHLSVASTHLAFRPAESMETLLALARTNNFELRLRAVELAQQGFRVQLVKNERFPAISVGPSISEERAGDRERIIGVGVSLPLPLWNRNKGNIEAVLGQVEALVEFADPQQRYPAGAFVTATFTNGDAKTVSVVPESALLTAADGTYVYTVNGSHLIRTRVRPGAVSDGFVEIEDGLYAGDSVAAKGVDGLWLGMRFAPRRG